MRIIHPMDTGLAAGIPAFHIDDIVITRRRRPHAEPHPALEPVSENPSFTLDLRAAALAHACTLQVATTTATASTHGDPSRLLPSPSPDAFVARSQPSRRTVARLVLLLASHVGARRGTSTTACSRASSPPGAGSSSPG